MKVPSVKVGEVIKFVRGITFKPDDQVEPLSKGSAVVMRTKNVQVAGLDESDLIAVPKSFVKREEQNLREGDILISSANSWELVGKVSYVPALKYEATAGGFISIVRAKVSEIDSRYLYHWISSPLSQHKIRYCGRQTTNISNLDVGRFKDLEIPLPPLTEQKRIATILDKADAIRRKRQQAIQLADEFLRAVFLDMFGDPVTNPKGWVVKPLKEQIIHANNGLSRRRKEPENLGEIVLRLQDVHYDGIRYEKDLNRIALDESEKRRYQLDNGDILFIRVNGNPDYVGRSAVFKGYSESVYHNDHLIRIKIGDGYVPEFLSYCFNHVGGRKIISGQIKTSAGQHTISQGGIEALNFYLPPIKMQKKFVAIKASVLNLPYGKSSCVNLFDSLGQKAFSGKL